VKHASFDIDKAVTYWLEGAKYEMGATEDILTTGQEIDLSDV
jgi:hypothetical protein